MVGRSEGKAIGGPMSERIVRRLVESAWLRQLRNSMDMI